jgi:NAD(P)-dependent dehydrogenase (short-subunit alcohol dehydrogenase family)
MTKKTVMITGCSSGIGKLTAKTFHERGWRVVATMRSPEKEDELSKLDDVLVTRLDVTDPASVKQAVDEALGRFGSIDVVVNNAGYGGHTLFEQASDQAIRAMYETNVFGVMNVSRAVLPLMRARKQGCIINVTSMAGMMAAPAISVYASTKHAVQGLTEGMALECKPLGILVKSVLPGAYPTTRFNANTADAELEAGDDELLAYAQKIYAHLQAVAHQMAMQGGEDADPQEVADKIYECATSDTPVHNPVGADAQMLIGMMGNAPRQDFLDKLEGMLLPPQ